MVWDAMRGAHEVGLGTVGTDWHSLWSTERGSSGVNPVGQGTDDQVGLSSGTDCDTTHQPGQCNHIQNAHAQR